MKTYRPLNAACINTEHQSGSIALTRTGCEVKTSTNQWYELLKVTCKIEIAFCKLCVCAVFRLTLISRIQGSSLTVEHQGCCQRGAHGNLFSRWPENKCLRHR